MQRLMLWLSFAFLIASTSAAEVVVFVDGSRMEVRKYEVRGELVVLTTLEGKLRSLPRSYVDLGATEKANRVSGPAQSAPAPVPPEPAAAPAPPEPSSTPPPASGAPPAPPSPPQSSRSSPAAAETVAAPVSPPEPAATTPMWTSEELAASLVFPSSAWRAREIAASFDVAAQIDKSDGETRATLALIRRPVRDYRAFQKVVEEIRASAAATPGFRQLSSAPLVVGPYSAHEVRFVRDVQGRAFFNRLVSFYSKDLVYLLSLSCPEDRLAENESDFEALVRGFVIKKARGDLTPKGAPRN